MKELIIFITTFFAFITLQVYVSSLNPCSQFSDEPHLCSSDGVKNNGIG